MNILFYTTYQVAAHKGGTERVTTRTSESLKQKGHHCYSAYKMPISKEFELTEFEASIQIKSFSNLKAFVIRHEIDLVIIQGVSEVSKLFVRLRNDFNIKIKILSVYHFSPGAERYMISFYNKKKILNNKKTPILQKIKTLFIILIYPLYKYWKIREYRLLYKYVYEKTDKVILLSRNFIPEFMAFGRIEDSSKFDVIPNSLSYDVFASNEDINNKKKSVLIVSRLEEVQKRISKAIQIWSRIEADNRLNKWNLYVLGMGESMSEYQKMVAKLNLHRIYFEGIREPRDFYLSSSIFMMTSKYEGWGLTLTEAQQFGCVPLAFNTYSSLSDIINNGENGFIVPDDDIDLYVLRMKEVMLDDNCRHIMAQNAVKMSKRFEIRNVGNLWCNLLESL